MRKKVNRAAVCSSENYSKSKKLHLDYLKERHSHFKEIIVNGELAIDIPVLKDGMITPKYKTIKVFGKEMRVTINEYNLKSANYDLNR